MQITATIVLSLASLVGLLLPVQAYHLESERASQKLNRPARAIESAPLQPQENQQQNSQQQQQQQRDQQQQQQQSLYERPRELEFLDEPYRMVSENSGGVSRLLSPDFPLDKARIYSLTHDRSPTKSTGGRWMIGHIGGGYPRTARADNFIRFGRSFTSGFGTNIKKNNFIRLGRENPRQNNFIRLGRSGPWDSSEKYLPKIGYVPDNYFYSTGSHWSRPSDVGMGSLNMNQELSTPFDEDLVPSI